MTQKRIIIGIDLGTTNSAIAVVAGTATEVVKNNVDADITPSAVYINRSGNLWVGDGNGGIVSVPDGADPPADPNACSSGVCNGGTPSATPRPAGTGCPGGVCDGSGNCGCPNGQSPIGPNGECCDTGSLWCNNACCALRTSRVVR